MGRDSDPDLREYLLAMAKAKHGALRFTRLRLRNWRNFDDLDIRLGARAFFVGPNASGKSNLLNVFRLLKEIATLGSGGLQAALSERAGFAAVRNLNARKPSDVEIEVEVGTESHPALWQYLLRLNLHKKQPTIIEESVRHAGSEVKTRKIGPHDDACLFAQSYLEQAEISKSFRELCDFFSSCRYLHVVPQIVQDRERARRDGEDPHGGDLLRRMKELPAKRREARFARISTALAIAVPQFAGLGLVTDMEGIPHLEASYKHWRPNASKQNEAAFSDGTLRLIGLLWSISESGGPLLLEEPELSLNDAIVSQLPRMFRRMQVLSDRQVIATTHSLALLDDSGIGLSEVYIIKPGSKGSTVVTAAADLRIAAQVEGGMTIAEAVQPLLRPENADRLGSIDVAA